jgi:putative ABC transport system permease protein
MISSRWYKVLNDLLGNKTRTVLIVLSIAVGLFAVGTMVSSRTMLMTEMAAAYQTINPSSGTVRTGELFDEEFVRSVRAMDGVADADGRRILSTRVKIGPNEWQNLTLFAVEDFDEMRVNKVFPVEGAWPPPDREVLIERNALQVINAEVGDTILIETPDGKQRWMRLAGSAHDMALMPAQIDGTPYGYISFKTIEWFGEPHGLDELNVVADRPDDAEYALNVVNEVKDKAERAGMSIPMSMTAEPGQIPMDTILDGLLLLMGAMGLLALFLSGFLIVNTVTAVLAQQKRQIGIMKALGATTGQLMGMYLAMVTTYGAAALVLSLPASIVGSRLLSRLMAAMFNFDLTTMRTPPLAIFLQVIVGLLVPVVASLYPFLANLRISAAQAMSSFQLGRGRFGRNVIDRTISGANLWFARRVLKRPIVLAIRNTFRSKLRLTLTLATLSLASAIFVSVFSIRASLYSTIDDMLQWFSFDSLFVFSDPYREDRIKQVAQEVPGVAMVDTWVMTPIRRVRDDGTEGKMIYAFASRPESELSGAPSMLAGRWLLPEDENAIVVDTVFLRDEPDVKVGDDITIKIGGHERTCRVVGASAGFVISMARLDYDFVGRNTGRMGQADTLVATLDGEDPDYIKERTTALEAHLGDAGLHVTTAGTMAMEMEEANAIYGVIIALLLFMAFLLAVVGGLGLMGTMSINVLERTREIGVLRAIGAPNRGVARVFIMEGVAIGLMSWLLGSLLSVLLSKLLCDAVGIAISDVPLSYVFSTTGMWLWLVLVVLLSALASFVPARNASRMTVREVLAYE